MAKNVKLRVVLSKDRNKTGMMYLEADNQTIAGFKVLGRGSKGSGDTSMKKNGNTPTGTYSGNERVSTGMWNQKSYGPHGAIRLQPTSGRALKAKGKGRSGLLIHGGDLSKKGYFRGEDQLRATYGCLRLSNADMDKLFTKLIEVSENHEERISEELNVTIDVKEY